MYLKFLRLGVKNFMSFGNNMNEFTFENGLTLISAKNGSGKSSIGPEALSYVLYGKPYRDIKVGELVNRKNKKGLYTEIEFLVESDKYKIVRAMLPNKLELYKNDVIVESLSSKALNQEEIDKLLGIDHKLFKMIIALSVNYNKPFLSLSVPEKRGVLESIFDVKVFSEMLSKLKKQTSSIKIEKQMCDNNMKTLESSILALRKQIKEVEESIKTFDQDKEEDLKQIESNIQDLKIKIEENDKLREEILHHQKNIVLDSEDYDTKINECNTNIRIDETKIKDYSKQLKFIKNNTVCPLCSHELDDEHKAKEEEKIKKEVEKCEKKIEKNKKSLETLSKKNIAKKEKESDKKELERKFNELFSTFGQLSFQLSSNEKEKVKVNARQFNFNMVSLQSEYDSQVVSYKENAKKSAEYLEELKTNEYVSKMLSDDGIKTYFFKRLVPILNMKINEYLDMFEINIKVEFDDGLYETISIPGTSEKNVNYLSFSEGEKKRIDVAILLSFIDTTKIVSNWNCNLLYFDEILDNATDNEGLDKLLTAIKEMTLKDNRLCSYIISHREATSEHFDRKITIKKVAGFSKIG